MAAETVDLLVIGGGITGAGIARDAALRGLRVALVEQRDFASGTSSRSTKLIHGGLRYLRQGNFRLVREALTERSRILHLAPHLVTIEPLLFPLFGFPIATRVFYQTGMTLYDVLGVTPTADAEELRRAYLSRARESHPDRYVDAPPADRGDAERRMRDVNEAWRVLGNPRRRRRYDLELMRRAAKVTGRFLQEFAAIES